MLEFWALTPAETVAAVRASRRRREQEQRQSMALAWMIEALARMKRLPSLKQWLEPEPEAPDAALLAERQKEFEELSARMGGARAG